MLSRVSIRQDLRLPGFFGELVSESFGIFAQISERKHIIDRKNIAVSIDKLMIELSEISPSLQGEKRQASFVTQNSSAMQNSCTAAGIIILVFAVILSWVPFVLSVLPGAK
ncbi:hypothetical protein FACS189479_02750 [Spirochaetia bacterium]|nr:hypothetical protein FACS189479_02750 [Spirochaetia bacterium]